MGQSSHLFTSEQTLFKVHKKSTTRGYMFNVLDYWKAWPCYGLYSWTVDASAHLLLDFLSRWTVRDPTCALLPGCSWNSFLSPSWPGLYDHHMAFQLLMHWMLALLSVWYTGRATLELALLLGGHLFSLQLEVKDTVPVKCWFCTPNCFVHELDLPEHSWCFPVSTNCMDWQGIDTSSAHNYCCGVCSECVYWAALNNTVPKYLKGWGGLCVWAASSSSFSCVVASSIPLLMAQMIYKAALIFLQAQRRGHQTHFSADLSQPFPLKMGFHLPSWGRAHTLWSASSKMAAHCSNWCSWPLKVHRKKINKELCNCPSLFLFCLPEYMIPAANNLLHMGTVLTDFGMKCGQLQVEIIPPEGITLLTSELLFYE